jgi:Ferritin-like domain
MESIDSKKAAIPAEIVKSEFDVSRRRFLQLAGGVAGAGLFLAACHKRTPPSDIYIGEGDTALLNYLYILEQLEANFYIQAAATPYYQISASELGLLTDMRDQEIGHREFLKTLLGQRAIPNIVTNFSTVSFADRTSVLSNGAALEDMIVSGFNGVVHLFKNKDYAVPVTKMVTVEARHSAYFRDALTLNTFAPNPPVSANGLDQAQPPSVIFPQALVYIQTRFDSSKLPS